MNHEMVGNRVETLVRSKARFLQFLERRLGNRADAEDLLQTAFLKPVAQGDSLRDKEKLVPWFYQFLRNLRLHRARRALRDGLQTMCGVCAEHGCLDCTCRREKRP